MEKKKKLIDISRETIDLLSNQDIEVVFPSIYKDIFNNKLKENNLEVEDDFIESIEYNTKTMLEQQKKLYDTTETFSDNLNKASEAIDKKDDISLKQVQQEMINLKNELNNLTKELYSDELTNVKNRKWLCHRFLENSEYLKEDGYLVFIDLNDFKIINDSYGHIVGDKVLKYFAFHLSKIDNCEVVRYAGDEFLLLSKCSKVDEKIIKMLSFFKKTKFKHNNEDSFKIGFSYGIQRYEKTDLFKDVLDKADEKMYKNKKTK